MSEQATNAQLPIVRQENMQMIVKAASNVYEENNMSCKNCNDFGQRLFEQVTANGMTDQLDQQCADYINRVKKTIKKMNAKRSAVTKLFDQIRSEFTGMENAIDPGNAGTIPYKVQQARNAYAASKRAAEEARRKAELLRQQREQAISNYRADVENDYNRSFGQYSAKAINALSSLNASVTLDNYEAQREAIKHFPVDMPADWAAVTPCHVPIPEALADMAGKLSQERAAIIAKLMPVFADRYKNDVDGYRHEILIALPSKYDELQRIQKASEEEKARLAAELKAHEEAEAKRIEQERKRKEEEEAAKRKMQAEASEVGNLFGQQAIVSPAGYQPKTSVRKRLVFHNQQGILAAVSLWWSKEGQNLSVDELAKTFKKQVAFCEKLANDKNHPEFISSTAVSYEEEVKAK